MKTTSLTLTGVLAGLIFIAFASSLVNGDIFTPSNSCHKPFKPYKFTSQFELDTFNEDVRRFKTCIERFVEEQEEAIRNHRSAANEAIAVWNRFVRLELQ